MNWFSLHTKIIYQNDSIAYLWVTLKMPEHTNVDARRMISMAVHSQCHLQTLFIWIGNKINIPTLLKSTLHFSNEWTTSFESHNFNFIHFKIPLDWCKAYIFEQLALNLRSTVKTSAKEKDQWSVGMKCLAIFLLLFS